MRVILLTCLSALSLLAQGPRYSVIDLGALPGGNSSFGNVLNNNRQAGGNAGLADGTQQAVIWEGPFRVDLGTPGLNSAVYGINSSGQSVIGAELNKKDPNNENFCAWGTPQACGVFLWQRGVATQLPTLGGTNATTGNINARGEIAGVAETTTRDAGCPAKPSFDGSGPVMYDFEPVVWGPAVTAVRQLKLPAGDTVGQALWINDSGQAAGSTGTCANSSLPPIAFGSHAVMWDADGTVHDLGNLGSNVIVQALSINNHAQVAGVSAIRDDATPEQGHHAFFWSQSTGMKDVGLLSGDVASVGTTINDSGDVAGESADKDGNPRAFLWHAGTMYDLNDLAAGSSLYLLCALSINERGEITGFGVTEAGDIHAFLATSGGGTLHSAAVGTVQLPEEVRRSARERLGRGWRK